MGLSQPGPFAGLEPSRPLRAFDVEREELRLSREADSKERLQRALTWSRRVGFTETQAPWSALCALSMKHGRKGAPVSASDVRARLAQTHPQLFIDPSQLELFGEEAF